MGEVATLSVKLRERLQWPWRNWLPIIKRRHSKLRMTQAYILSVPKKIFLIWAFITVTAMTVIAMLFFDSSFVAFSRSGDPDMHRIFSIITNFGLSEYYLVPSGILVLALSSIIPQYIPIGRQGRISSTIIRAAYLFASVAISGIIVRIFKIAFGRARPKFFESLGAYDFSFLSGFGHGLTSFPSGHATTAGAAAIALAILYPRGKLFFILIGLAIAFSRVMVGAHFLSDVICGFALGAFVSILLADWLARCRLGFRHQDNGKIFAFPTWSALAVFEKFRHKAKSNPSNPNPL